MRTGGKFYQKVSRLNEFYDWEEIDYFIYNVRIHNLNPYSAITWLNAQTIVRYITEVDLNPRIESMTLEYLIEKSLK